MTISDNKKLLSHLFVLIFIFSSTFTPFLMAEAALNIPTNITSDGGEEVATIQVQKGTSWVTRVTTMGSANNFVEYFIKEGEDSALFKIDRIQGIVEFKSAIEVLSRGERPFEILVYSLDSSGFVDQQKLKVILVPSIPWGSYTDLTECPDAEAGHFIFYQYNSHVESFDLIFDQKIPFRTAEVTIGGKTLPPQYVTKWSAQSGRESKVHIDVPSDLMSPTKEIIQVTLETETLSSSVGCIYTQQHEFNSDTQGKEASGTFSLNPIGDSTGRGTTQEEIDSSVPSTTSYTALQCISQSTYAHWITLTILHALGLILIVYVLSVLSVQGRRFLISVAIVSFVLFTSVWFVQDVCTTAIWFPIVTAILSSLAVLKTVRDEKRTEEA